MVVCSVMALLRMWAGAIVGTVEIGHVIQRG
jgi:hypothetical protein